ncbi:STAS domain-containing protein [Actinoplanes sp. NPDC051851]|uniref:STAS domain-containing protein n=1 Tax=Actinoplanes sp. NPDC051851 TaxID=3154753 RepID=UPI00343C20D8
MTAVTGDGTGVVTLICDNCGRTENSTDVLNDEDMVWPNLNELGWTGSPFAGGTHRCPSCSISIPRERRATRNEKIIQNPGAFEVRRHDELRATVIAPLTDLDSLVADAVRPVVMSAATAGRNVVMDLAAVGFVDSAGLGLLVRAHREARHRGAALLLAAPSRFVQTVLHTMRLDGMFQTFPDRARALECLTVRP